MVASGLLVPAALLFPHEKAASIDSATTRSEETHEAKTISPEDYAAIIDTPFHIHADLLVLLNGNPLDLTLDRYQSTENNILSLEVHLHDNKGNVIHVHSEGVTLGRFFETLGMRLTANCLALDTGARFCDAQISAEDSQGLRFAVLVNGEKIVEPETYIIDDLDRILIYLGEDDDRIIASAMSMVSDEACIQSLQCPDRGIPSGEESCAGTTCLPPWLVE